MNMISTIRARVNSFGSATITLEEYNQLQAEWIKRCCPEKIKIEVEEKPAHLIAYQEWTEDEDGWTGSGWNEPDGYEMQEIIQEDKHSHPTRAVFVYTGGN